MMDVVDDDDIRLHKASASLLSSLQSLLAVVLWKGVAADAEHRHAHRLVRQHDLDRLLSFIEPFQEDPQLLDVKLKSVVPQLIEAYLESLSRSSSLLIKPGTVTLNLAISKVLYTLCKVRGQKVIVTFFNNEPRYLEPILGHLESGLAGASFVWEEKFVTLVWLSHFVLTPFDLFTISSRRPVETAQQRTGIAVPENLPGIVNRIVPICIGHLNHATTERDAASRLLVRLCLRADMRKLGLLDSLVEWALSFFNSADETASDIHTCLGVMHFLSGLVASANSSDLGAFLFDIYKACDLVINQERLAFIKCSAVARRLLIKTFRHISIHYLQSEASIDCSSSFLEEIIDFLLQAVGDGDSTVRYAASKALGTVTMRLPSELGVEVIEALLACLSEDILWEGSARSFAAVNPLRWHGLTLTLSQLLYHKAPPTHRLPAILNALLLALTFEQRSATGVSIGTNVRDAACFGIWALSRRYTTIELSSVDASSIPAATGYDQALSIPQILAIELLVAACLDPAGNIRRASSAALQELIGRHPDTVLEGISLVQVVDFHAVGLRDRAMNTVGVKAAHLDYSYWHFLFDGMLGWRGVGSPDMLSRTSTAQAIGRLSSIQPYKTVKAMVERVRKQLYMLHVRKVEERQGFILALASLMTEIKSQHAHEVELAELAGLWKLFDGELDLPERMFTSPALRPDLTAFATCTFVAALASLTRCVRDQVSGPMSFNNLLVLPPMDLSLGRTDDSVLRVVPAAVANASLLLGQDGRKARLHAWLRQVNAANTRTAIRDAGHVTAVGAIYATMADSTDRALIIEFLTSRCTNKVEIEARVVALRSLQLVFEHAASNAEALLKSKIADALLIALNDYTINHRGDVGSLVRLEALNAVDRAWTCGLLVGLAQDPLILANVTRLSLEKLDKVRLKAAKCLQLNGTGYLESEAELDACGISSRQYFARAMQRFGCGVARNMDTAILEGCVSSAGIGFESVVQASRLALVERLQTLDTESDACSLLHAGNSFMDVFSTHLETDRIVLSILEVLAFLLDAHILQRLVGSSFQWRKLLSLVQQAHFKSRNIQKLCLALNVYRGLADIPVIRLDTLMKMANMLMHPFPKIRVVTAEMLFVTWADEQLKAHDWSQPAKSLKSVADEIKMRVALST